MSTAQNQQKKQFSPQRKTSFEAPSVEKRMRRLRRTSGLRDLVRETVIRPDDFILPAFVEENLDSPAAISTMPGVYRQTEKTIGAMAQEAYQSGVKAMMLFGVSHNKDNIGSDAMTHDGLLYRMINRVKESCPEMTVIADTCFCEYTDHGHCGVLEQNGDVNNDRTLENLGTQAIIAADAGADMIAPSAMMDGMVETIRAALDQNGYEQTPIMSYSSKFASNFYGPFREAAGCSLGKGNRKTYQMDPANAREALLESALDEAEGADILMVKPGMPYLDILSKIKEQTLLPVAVYQVSGEYAMIKIAGEAGAIDEKAVMMESMLAFKRAGADLILSYGAIDIARSL
jgi:porphobilinogen synthase